MVRRTDPKDDGWQHVTDAKKRKQIQDRLAQRARRKRLREAKLRSIDKTNHDSSTHPSEQCNCNSSRDSDVLPTDQDQTNLQRSDEETMSALLLDHFHPLDPIDPALSNDPLAVDSSLTTLSTFSPSTASYLSPLLLSPQSQPSPPLNVFSALYLNGSILGLTCSICFSSRSPQPSLNHPPALHPTETQLQVVHPRWFDRLPFPRMRDSLIRLIGAIDEEELLKDLFTMPSWRIETAGRGKGMEAAWDPTAWKMEKEWAVKWGWLMY
ncbi:hypothetical protein EK21DRAFT_84851 [Setomelanomma holmii]|uniref:BZIP domain-containing protein n=1 Tax=Setomelanomma holmii TaxID=210430 RepID=A0A9P4HKK6_9PLEO|nr:hypothetical protein EK21DRAFT_84851 [Setomelanomma holmii]